MQISEDLHQWMQRLMDLRLPPEVLDMTLGVLLYAKDLAREDGQAVATRAHMDRVFGQLAVLTGPLTVERPRRRRRKRR
jgi:hypothetical protein